MRQTETGIRGDRDFHTTVWSDILSAADPDDPRARACVERLLRTYWSPVFAFIRTTARTSIEDAKDLTQAFFARMLEKSVWRRVSPVRGSFRGYLKRALRHFLANEARSRALRAFALDIPRAEFEQAAQEPADLQPDHAYDRAWFRCVMHQAVTQLDRALAADGKDAYFRVFNAYCLGGDDATYADVAARLRLKETDVRNYLTHARRVLRDILRDIIREYVASDVEVEAELLEAVRA